MTSVKQYYRTKESRWGYRLLLGGVRHFGYYPATRKVSHHQAQVLMMDQVAKALGLPKGARVLDAGCGEGATAIHLALNHGYEMRGIDLLPESVKIAKNNASRNGLPRAMFRQGSYMKLPYKDNSLDGLYAQETFCHAPDAKAALREFMRVLVPGGKLLIVDYTIQNPSKIRNAKLKHALDDILKYASLPTLSCTYHGSYPGLLSKSGLSNIKSRDITSNVLPMLRWFYKLSIIPYQVLHFRNKLEITNTATGYYLYRIVRAGYWRFVVVAAQKPKH